jgi:hypothetical protein
MNRYVVAQDSAFTQYGYTISNLQTARFNIASNHIQGNIVFFAGGRGQSSAYAYVDAYNTSLTKVSAENLSAEKQGMGIANTANYALFFGGGYAYHNGTVSTIDMYDSSCTHTVIDSLNCAKYAPSATVLDKYILVGGGINTAGVYLSEVEVYDLSLTKDLSLSSSFMLSEAKSSCSAITLNNFALFIGGVLGSSTYSSVIEGFTI